MQADRSLPDSRQFLFLSDNRDCVCVMLIIHIAEKPQNRVNPTTLHPTPLLGCPLLLRL